ncbi:hypothetical protein ZOSMA_234G00260 [Zostera marina]|uniref:Retrotransposon gag domain-containing protein n=1 Tax=Zostera marina TaxID=29655 RepID=A0A0K9PI90_ZOSMR|nr:hypothetical protein ZOSMA_234G00260 [Zostera marina]
MSWYTNLPHNNINNFEELRHKFLEAFNHLIRRKTVQGALLNVKQKTNETLREYVKRFAETLNRVEQPSGSAAIMAFKVGLRPTRFAVKIAENLPINIADLFEKAYNAMDIEKMLEEKYKEFKTPTMNTTHNRNNPSILKPKENQRDKFLELQQSTLPPTRPMNEATAQARNNDKYCEYHKDKGHTSNDCRALEKVLAEREKVNSPQINLIEKSGPSKTIFCHMVKSIGKKEFRSPYDQPINQKTKIKPRT